MEKVLKESIINFKKGLISRREIISNLTNLIFNSLKRYKIKDREIIQDFYFLIISNIEKIINCYKEEKFPEFIPWFNKVIKRYFLNFIKKHNKIKNNKVETIEDVNTEILSDNFYIKQNIDYPEMLKNLKLSELTNREKEVLSLKLGLIEDKEINSFIEEKIKKIKEIEDNLNFRYVKLLKVQSNILKETRKEEKNRLKEIEKKIINGKRKMEKALKTLSVLPTDGLVSQKLGISETTVSVLFGRIKNKLRNNNFQELVEKMYN